MADKKEFKLSRRSLIKGAGVGLAGMAVGLPARANDLPGPNPVDTGGVEEGKVAFPNWKGEADTPGSPPPAPLPEHERIGFAIVGLGRLSLEEILPAFAESKKARPVALVSGSPQKAKLVAKQYGIKDDAVYDYADFDKIAANPEVQVVYVVLPNAMHREYVERAAKAGKHVLCEKPMATSSSDARAMVEACKAAKVQLMIAYRCQYEPYNREAIRLIRSKAYGELRFIEAINTQSQGNPSQWRLKQALSGGGALPDIGLYCLNAARYITGEEPLEVYAQWRQPKDDERFKEVEEAVSFMLRFPSGVIAQCVTSYDAHDTKELHLQTQKALIDINKAFAYHGQQMKITHRDGDHDLAEMPQLEAKNQFALEIDHLATCIKEGREVRTPGEEGLQDQIIMEAIYASAKSGKPVSLAKADGLDITRGPEPEKS